MLIAIERVLSAEQVEELRVSLLAAGDAWVDGRVSAGFQGAPVKFNLQIDEASAVARRCQEVVLAALERHPLFISAALPNTVYPPMFNRYGEGMTFGAHVDGGVRIDPRTGRKLRTDISATLFLSDPDDYDGGELEVADTYGSHSVKLAAGDLVLYPASSLHQVTPIYAMDVAMANRTEADRKPGSRRRAEDPALRNGRRPGRLLSQPAAAMGGHLMAATIGSPGVTPLLQS